MAYKITFVGAHAHEPTPHISLYAVTPQGQISHKLARITEGTLALPAHHTDIVAFGPDVADPTRLNPKAFVQMRVADHLANWNQQEIIALPAPWWRGWLWFTVCLSGTARRCTPFYLEQINLRAIALGQNSYRPTGFCQPLCNAVVEIWDSVTCCWPIPIIDVPRIIANLGAYLVANPIMFPVPPRPDPGPIESRLIARVDQALAAGKIDRRFMPSPVLSQHLTSLENLSAQDALAYIQGEPSLWFFYCSPASTEKLGEVPLNPDGSFSFYFQHYPFFDLNCRTSYFYKIRQTINGVSTYIYDGAAAHELFNADQIANLTTSSGQTCFQTPSYGPGTATFQAIGLTNTWQLNSHWAGAVAGVDQTQTSATTLAAPPADGGLRLGDGAPWGSSLSLLLNFEVELKAMGAVYYRLTITQANSAGGPLAGAPVQVLDTPVSWQYFDIATNPVTTPYRPLGPNTVVSGSQPVAGLFLIPYQDGVTDWLGNQFHQVLDTTLLPDSLVYSDPSLMKPGNGRFLLSLEIFDVNGNRLIPLAGPAPSAGSTDVATPFSFVRRIDNMTTPAVNFEALTHLIWVDNRPPTAGIHSFGYVDGGSPVVNTEQCQFLTASSGAYFQVGFHALHQVTCDPSPSPLPTRSFMAGFNLSCEEGLNGTPVTLDYGDDVNRPNTCLEPTGNVTSPTTRPMTPSKPAIDSSFGTLLGTHPACAFSVTLAVSCKHTNGVGNLYPYSTTSSVALSL